MRDILVSVSGGKDSQACLKLMCERYGSAQVLGVFADTGWEHPITYAHIDFMRALYGVKIETIHSKQAGGSTVESQILNRGNFPNGNNRFCTSNLKIRALYKHALSYAEKYRLIANETEKDRTVGNKFSLNIGIRLSESKKRNDKYGGLDEYGLIPSEVLTEYTKKFDSHYILNFPVLNWSERKIFEYLCDEVNPLYADGFKRVGCFPCLAHEGKKGLSRAYNYDAFGAQQKERVIALENQINIKHHPSNTGQMCLFCAI